MLGFFRHYLQFMYSREFVKQRPYLVHLVLCSAVHDSNFACMHRCGRIGIASLLIHTNQ